MQFVLVVLAAVFLTRLVSRAPPGQYECALQINGAVRNLDLGSSPSRRWSNARPCRASSPNGLSFLYLHMTKLLLSRSPRFATLVVVALIAYSFSGCNLASSPSNSLPAGSTNSFVSGKVVDGGTGKPLAGAYVQFGDTSNVMFTGADGAFGLPEGHGDHNLIIAKPGYDSREVSDIYNAKNVGTESMNSHAQLIAQYGVSGDGTDASGHGHSGTATGVTSAAGPFGNAGQGLHFSGASSSITVPISTDFDFDNPLKDFSFSFWVKLDPNTPSGAMPVITRWSGSWPNESGYHVYLYVGTDGTFSVSYQSHTDNSPDYGGPGSDDVGSRSRLPIAGWHHVLISVSRQGGDVGIYLDGSSGDPVPSNSIASMSSIASSNPLIIGSSATDGAFTGTLDDVRIYQNLLTQYDASLLMRGAK